MYEAQALIAVLDHDGRGKAVHTGARWEDAAVIEGLAAQN